MALLSVRWRSDTSRPPLSTSILSLRRSRRSRGEKSVSPRCRQLDGERQPVEPSADLGDVGGVVHRDLETGLHRPGPLRKEPDRLRQRDHRRRVLRGGK